MADLDRIERELRWRRGQSGYGYVPTSRSAVDDDVAALLAEVRSLRQEVRDLAELLEGARQEIERLKAR